MALFTNERITFWAFAVVLLIFLGINLALVAPFLIAILSGAVLSLLGRPFHKRLLARRMGLRGSAVLTTVIIALVVVVPVGLFTFRAVQQGADLVRYLNTEVELTPGELVRRLTEWGPVQSLLGDAGNVERRLRGWAESGLRTVSSGALALLGRVPEMALQITLALLSCYFFLVDGRRFLAWLSDKLPLEEAVKDHLYGTFRDTAISTIWATVAAATVQSLILLAAYLILGIPAAFLAAGATFILAWIPVVGSGPVWIGGAIYLYLDGSLARALVMVGFGIVASLADNVVRPMVLKGRGGMHPLVGLVAVFGGIRLFGLLGVFFGPILMAVLISLVTIVPSVLRRVRGPEPARTAA